MAQFTNQAQLSYNGNVVNSNVVVGEILDTLSAAKKAVTARYKMNDKITYVISAVNSGTTAISGITVSDDLGGYTFGTETLYPLTYVDGSVLLYINGILQAAPTVAAGPPLVISGITLPADSSMVLVYEAQVNAFAPEGQEDSIVNTATLTGTGIITPVTVTETITPENEPDLTITKNIDPVPVNENGTITYTFTIQNYENTEADATDLVAVTDTFDPILSGLRVTFNGAAWTAGTNYNYDEATGVFSTVAGQITVPAATFTQNETTGAWAVTPGVSTLTVTGTI